MRMPQLQQLRAIADVNIGPRYLLVVGRHVNCPKHDAPVGHDLVEIQDLPELLDYLVRNVNDVHVRVVYTLDARRPDLQVTEIYGSRHSVDGLRLDFATPEETTAFLGPWTWSERDGFRDRAELDLDTESLRGYIQGFRAEGQVHHTRSLLLGG